MPTIENQSDSTPVPPRSGTKLYKIFKQLQSGKGTTLDRMMKATDWQVHTVRATLTGLRKRGYQIQRTASSTGASIYMIGKASGAVT